MKGKPHYRAASVITCGLVAVALVLGLAWFAVTIPVPLTRALLDQCAGYEELGDAPANVSGFQELAPPDCG